MHAISKLAAAMMACLFMAGCHGDVRAVWTGNSGSVPRTMAAVGGFTITPHEAQAAAESAYGVRKTVQHLYADDRFYYIVDGLLGSSRSKAARVGVRVDGRAGECIRFRRP